ncbi:isoprenoid synthase domain-containing protein [Rhexocercosporidium sp. MPI-PUGE-AT-0058]|nr:isoprenoid synthase domain-containing protein [Rhexocercosporidium sp. MPI-PUGE-AT-0058]
MGTEAKAKMEIGHDQRNLLLHSIRGTTVTIPDLRPIFEKYTGPVNPNYEAMVPVVNSRLESLVSNEKRLAKLKTADFALFASNWWPTAEFRELRIVAFLAIWLFLWDDALDEPTGEHAENFEAAQLYRAETERFLADCLSLSTSKEISTVVTYPVFDSLKGFGMQLKKLLLEYFLGVSPKPQMAKPSSGGFLGSVSILGKKVKSAAWWTLGMKTEKKVSPASSSHPIIESFRVIGDELKVAYTIEQRQNFFEDMKFYIATTETEQRYKLDGKIPTLKEYWEARMGTSAVAACLAMIELVHHIKGPYRSTNHPSLKTLSDESNIIVVIANDMLSLKKEIAQRQIDSLIPLSVPVYGGVQEAIDQAHIDLLASVARFDAESKKVLSEPNTTGMSDSELRLFVEGCRRCWVGNFNWSLCTGRYGLGAIDQKKGSFSLSL